MSPSTTKAAEDLAKSPIFPPNCPYGNQINESSAKTPSAALVKHNYANTSSFSSAEFSEDEEDSWMMQVLISLSMAYHVLAHTLNWTELPCIARQ